MLFGALFGWGMGVWGLFYAFMQWGVGLFYGLVMIPGGKDEGGEFPRVGFRQEFRFGVKGVMGPCVYGGVFGVVILSGCFDGGLWVGQLS